MKFSLIPYLAFIYGITYGVLLLSKLKWFVSSFGKVDEVPVTII